MLPAEEVLPLVSLASFPDQGMGIIIPLYLITCHLFYCKIFSASSLLHFPNMVLQLGITTNSPGDATCRICLSHQIRLPQDHQLLHFCSNFMLIIKICTYFELWSVYSIINVTVFQKYHPILNCNKFFLQQQHWDLPLCDSDLKIPNTSNRLLLFLQYKYFLTLVAFPSIPGII